MIFPAGLCGISAWTEINLILHVSGRHMRSGSYPPGWSFLTDAPPTDEKGWIRACKILPCETIRGDYKARNPGDGRSRAAASSERSGRPRPGAAAQCASNRDNGRGASLRRHVQSLKLAPGCMRSDGKHVHPDRRRLKAGRDADCKFAAEIFGHCSVLVLERG